MSPDPPALYNLDEDPSERFDIGADNPEVIATILRADDEHRAGLVVAPTQLDIPSWR